MTTEKEFCGIGRRERRRMVRQWREETDGRISLRAWAERKNPVGDAAYIWLKSKRHQGTAS